MKAYITPDMEITEFDEEDVITASTESDGYDAPNDNFEGEF